MMFLCSFQRPAVPLLVRMVQPVFPLCGAMFTYSSVYHHITAKHSGGSTKCPYCNYSMGWGKIKMHLRNIHKDKI